MVIGRNSAPSLVSLGEIASRHYVIGRNSAPLLMPLDGMVSRGPNSAHRPQLGGPRVRPSVKFLVLAVLT